MIFKLLPFIKDQSFSFDIRQENILITNDGELHLFDLYPVISSKETVFGLNQERDPYAVLLENNAGVLSGKAMTALINRSSMSTEEKDAWASLAQRKRQQDREIAQQEWKKFDKRQLVAIVKDIATELRQCADIHEVGFLDLSHGKARVSMTLI